MTRDFKTRDTGESGDGRGEDALAPGKRALTDSLLAPRAPVQEVAAWGVAQASAPLPHLAAVQRSFGPAHDLANIKAQVGGVGAEAADAMHAEAYATGDRVAFREAPSLHTAAHEAAHVVQQRAGVFLKDGLGDTGDIYEQHADAVADAVARGEAAASLLAGSVGAAAGSSRAVQRRDADRERGSGTDELERRVGSHGGDEDGSGGWGAEADDRGITDRANHYLWTRVALAAETLALPNAARHMRHYLGNTGAPLTVDVDHMLRDLEPLRLAYDRQLADARHKAEVRVASMGADLQMTSFTLTGERRSDVYCDREISSDWFFAIGGFTYWYTADVQVIPVAGGGAPWINIVFALHIFDRYNWDQGKGVEVAGIQVTDEQLGRLHRVGLAREYEVHGSSTLRDYEWEYAGVSTSAPTGTAPVSGDREGGRSDPSRDRGRRFDNVRGSGR